MMERDSEFYSELRQLNEDLLDYVKRSNTKSLYFDFSPTFQDYMDQLGSLKKKFQPKSTTTGPAFGSNTSTTTGPAFGSNTSTTTGPAFGSSTTTTTAPTFSFFSVPPQQQQQSTNEAGGKSNNTPPSEPNVKTFETAFGSNSTTPAPAFGSISTTTTGPAFGSNTFTTTAPTFSFFSVPPQQQQQSTNEAGGDGNNTPPPEPNVETFEEPNSKHWFKCKLYEKGPRLNDGEIDVKLLGIGKVFIKDMDQPNKLQIVVRQEPDYRRVLLNEMVTSSTPVRKLPKATQLAIPGSDGGNRVLIFKLKDETENNSLHDIINLAGK